MSEILGLTLPSNTLKTLLKEIFQQEAKQIKKNQ